MSQFKLLLFYVPLYISSFEAPCEASPPPPPPATVTLGTEEGFDEETELLKPPTELPPVAPKVEGAGAGGGAPEPNVKPDIEVFQRKITFYELYRLFLHYYWLCRKERLKLAMLLRY